MIQTKTKTKTVVKKPAKTYPILSEEGDLADALNETARMRAAGKVPKAKDAMKQVDKWNKEGKLSPKKMGGKVMKKAQSGGSLKTPTADQKGLKKLPTDVRNKMGFKKQGGTVKKAQMGANMTSPMMTAPMMKKGGMLKKCKSGCK